MISSWIKGFAGTSGVSPEFVFLDTDASLQDILAPGFAAGQNLTPGSIVFASLEDNGPKSAIFTVSEVFGEIVLTLSSGGGGGGGNNFDLLNTYFIAQNGDDLNSGLNANEPMRTIEGAIAKMTTVGDSYQLVILDSGTYSISQTINKNINLTINAPGATIAGTAQPLFQSNIGYGLIINCNAISTSAPGVVLVDTNSVCFIRASSVSGGVYGYGSFVLDVGVFAGTINMTGTGKLYGLISRSFATITGDGLIQAKIGADIYGDGSWNGYLTKAYYDSVTIVGPGTVTVSESWANKVVYSSGLDPISLLLPESSNVNLPAGFHFKLSQQAALAVVTIMVEGSDIFYSLGNANLTSGVGDTCEIIRVSTNGWLVDGLKLEIAGEPFNYENTYFVAQNGYDLNSGKNISAPKLTISAAIAALDNPSEKNVIYILDGGDYSQLSTITTPVNSNITIYAPAARIDIGSGTLFYVSSGSSLTVVAKELITLNSNTLIDCSTTGYYDVTTENSLGIIQSLSSSQCKFTCTGICFGDVNILTSVGAILEINEFAPGSTIISSRENLVGTIGYQSNAWVDNAYEKRNTENLSYSSYGFQPILYLPNIASILITPDDSGKLFVTTASAGSSVYNFALPDSTDGRLPQGFFFDVLIAGNSDVQFTQGSGDILLSDKGDGFNATAGIGSKVRIQLGYNRTVRHWVLSGNTLRKITGSSSRIFYVSKLNGNDTDYNGLTAEYPFASFSAAITAAGSPSFKTIIICIDGETYDENLVIPSANINISAPSAQLAPSSGDAITISSGSGYSNIRFEEIICPGAKALNSLGSQSVVLNSDVIVANSITTDDSIVVMIGDVANSDLTVSGAGSISVAFSFFDGVATGKVNGIAGSNLFGDITCHGDFNVGTYGAGEKIVLYPPSSPDGYINLYASDNSGSWTLDITNDVFSNNAFYKIPFISGVYYGYFAICKNQPDAQSNTFYVDTFIGHTSNKTLWAATTPTASYFVREVWIAKNANYLVGDRDIIITDGTTTYATIPAATLLALPNNSRWGSSDVMFGANAKVFATQTVPGANLQMQFSGGTTNYAAGTVNITVMLERIA